MEMEKRLEDKIDFILTLDQMKQITRQTYLSDGSRKENDAEHSWHLGMMVSLLAEYANEPIQIDRTMTMVLYHDVIEIKAGDTYAYDIEKNKTKKEREIKAADVLYGSLPQPENGYFRELWNEFEEQKTPEAKFANAMDCLQPILLTNRAEGKSWKEHDVEKSQIMGRVERIRPGSEILYQYARQIVENNIKKGYIKNQ